MKLPKSMTTVTPFSKKVALSLFIILPICAFFLGRSYQEKIDISNQKLIIEYKIQNETPTPSELQVETTCKKNNDCPSGYYCTRSGPVIYNPVTKNTSGFTCQKKGIAIPL